MDAITLLKEDHRNVEKLFKRFEKTGTQAYTAKREIVDSIIGGLSVHAVIEEQLPIWFPGHRAGDRGHRPREPRGASCSEVGLEELDSMSPEDERFDAKVAVLIEMVRHHVEEEEADFFPMVRDELGHNALNELGDALLAAKKVAATHPHPTGPDEPPGNVVAGVA